MRLDSDIACLPTEIALVSQVMRGNGLDAYVRRLARSVTIGLKGEHAQDWQDELTAAGFGPCGRAPGKMRWPACGCAPMHVLRLTDNGQHHELADEWRAVLACENSYKEHAVGVDLTTRLHPTPQAQELWAAVTAGLSVGVEHAGARIALGSPTTNGLRWQVGALFQAPVANSRIVLTCRPFAIEWMDGRRRGDINVTIDSVISVKA